MARAEPAVRRRAGGQAPLVQGAYPIVPGPAQTTSSRPSGAASNIAFVLPIRTESKYHRDVVAETKSLEFDSLPLMAVEIRFHADSAAFKMNLRAVGRIEEAFRCRGLQADAVYDRREFRASKADIPVPTQGLQQVVGKDSGTGITVAIQDTMLKVEWMKQAGDQASRIPGIRRLSAKLFGRLA